MMRLNGSRWSAVRTPFSDPVGELYLRRTSFAFEIRRTRGSWFGTDTVVVGTHPEESTFAGFQRARSRSNAVPSIDRDSMPGVWSPEPFSATSMPTFLTPSLVAIKTAGKEISGTGQAPAQGT